LIYFTKDNRTRLFSFLEQIKKVPSRASELYRLLYLGLSMDERQKLRMMAWSIATIVGVLLILDALALSGSF
jgi:hypothetical protein